MTAQNNQASHVGFWHKTDIVVVSVNARF